MRENTPKRLGYPTGTAYPGRGSWDGGRGRLPAGWHSENGSPRPRYWLERRQWLPLPRDPTFAFFAAPTNLPAITPPWLGFRILTPPPVVIATGLRIDYRVRVLGYRVRWRSLISAYDPPHAFQDVQVAGPYRFWAHTHRFWEEDGGTVVHDRVVYEPPFGPLGAVLNSLLIRSRLEAIFDYRRARIAELLLAPGSPVAQAGLAGPSGEPAAQGGGR